MLHFETSAKTAQQVNEAFIQITKKLIKEKLIIIINI